MNKYIIVYLLIVFLSSSCSKRNITPVTTENKIYNTNLGIGPVPISLGKRYTKHFDRYTKVNTPNGGTIHIVAQNKITDEQIIRCKGVLKHFLENYNGSLYGNNKDAIANKMSDNGAVLVLLNGKDDGKNRVNVPGQPLFQEEIQVEGTSWYINQNYNHRDATFEEILHLVHDYGIGVDGSNSNSGAAPEFQKMIRKAQQNALDKKIWGESAPDWIKELSKENSLSQEYLAAVIDSYYGLWGAWRESLSCSMWGIYKAKTREDIAVADPMGAELMDNKFFHPYLTYNARIDSSFTGTFTILFDKNIPYSHHSRYLKDLTLLGSSNTGVRLNGFDNTIKGNRGKNTVFFRGKMSEYTVSKSDNGTCIVSDNIANRDGRNTLTDVEILKFTDTEVTL